VSLYRAEAMAALRAARQKALAPHEEAEMRAQDLQGIVVDELPGVVGDDAWERATQGADSHWGLLP